MTQEHKKSLADWMKAILPSVIAVLIVLFASQRESGAQAQKVNSLEKWKEEHTEFSNEKVKIYDGIEPRLVSIEVELKSLNKNYEELNKKFDKITEIRVKK